MKDNVYTNNDYVAEQALYVARTLNWAVEQSAFNHRKVSDNIRAMALTDPTLMNCFNTIFDVITSKSYNEPDIEAKIMNYEKDTKDQIVKTNNLSEHKAKGNSDDNVIIIGNGIRFRNNDTYKKLNISKDNIVDICNILNREGLKVNSQIFNGTSINCDKKINDIYNEIKPHKFQRMFKVIVSSNLRNKELYYGNIIGAVAKMYYSDNGGDNVNDELLIQAIDDVNIPGLAEISEGKIRTSTKYGSADKIFHLIRKRYKEISKA